MQEEEMIGSDCCQNLVHCKTIPVEVVILMEDLLETLTVQYKKLGLWKIKELGLIALYLAKSKEECQVVKLRILIIN